MKRLYITSVSTYAGKTALSLGLGLRMQAAGYNVGYLKPVSTQPYMVGGRVLDEDADFVRRTLGLDSPPWELSPAVITGDILDEVMAGTLERDLLADVTQAVEAVSEDKDIVLLEGGASMREGYAVGLNTLSVVEALDVPVLSVVSYNGEECVTGMCVLDDALAAQKRLEGHLLGLVINAVPREDLAYVRERVVPFLEKNGIKVYGVLPYDPYLRALSVGEIVSALGAKVLTGSHLMERLVEHMSVGAMSVEAALPRFRRQLNKAVFTGGDRTDIQAAALETSTTCLVLTGNLQPTSTILKRAEELNVSVLLVPDSTLEAVEKVEGVFGKTSLGQPEKLSRFQAMLSEHLDYAELLRDLGI
ncbi:MAG TPA: phosphotransacetylase family protein [Aggregatilinea sp.]|jgi:BioD-like phosphotransacetylase family protein|uniref:phosphotransacetylase family protein n=1 Tax=Aggregatilinea sp. TaxID=2806333 RepID=UPI002B6531FE|nr:phosphotransacetylase family protein [Aggregatilinea sp.]HML21651.1 phosphotransacetylase family protein [Aggregatilinea sp.]